MNEIKSQLPTDNTKQRNALSLRAKILLGILLIVLFAVAAMGYFVFNRSQAASKLLVEQFDVSISREINNNLNIITSREANEISTFFSSMENVTSSYGATTGAFISTEKAIIPEENNWNAYLELSRLSNGSWDNSNDEISSIFSPKDMEINDSLAKELAALKGVDYFAKGLLEENPDVIAIFFGGTTGELVYYPNVDLSAIVPPDFDPTGRPWYLNSADQQRDDRKVTWSIPYLDIAHNGLVITSSIPVFDNTNSFRGVVGIDLKLATITERISNLVVGETGYSFLIDGEGRLIAMPSKGYEDFNLTEEEIQSGDVENLSLINRVSLDVFEVLAKMTSGQTGIRQVEIKGTNRYIAYRPIPVVGYSFGIVISEEEVLQDFVDTIKTVEVETRNTLFSAVGVSLFLLALAGLTAYGIGNSITAPLGKLTKTAEEVAGGNLDIRAEITTNDEIGLLARTLNNMTSTTQGLITTLEERVAERTKIIEVRASQTQAVAEVGKSVAAQRDLEELLTRTTYLISDRFNYYHVGIFLLDQRGEFAILRASNSRGGAKMLERGHKLGVGREGIVGTAAGTGEARIALDVGEDAVFFDNPDLSDTRSEMALPLIAGGETLGVLDIQSVEANAFSTEDIPTLQLLADQLAIAVQNARLLRDSQEALMRARKATADISQESWKALLQEVEGLGFVSSLDGEVTQATKDFDVNVNRGLLEGKNMLSEDQTTLNVPIRVRGQTIATMRLVKLSGSAPWSPDEIADVEQLSNQVGNTLESARLYQEAQQRAAQEQAIGKITSAIGASTRVDNILRSTVQALGRQLDDTEIVLELETDYD